MTKGEGVVALLYAIKGIIEAGAMWLITGCAVLLFFWVIVQFIGNKVGLFKGTATPFSSGKGVEPKNIMYALFLLFVIFAIYSLIALTGAVFGVNNSPSGGLYIQ